MLKRTGFYSEWKCRCGSIRRIVVPLNTLSYQVDLIRGHIHIWVDAVEPCYRCGSTMHVSKRVSKVKDATVMGHERREIKRNKPTQEVDEVGGTIEYEEEEEEEEHERLRSRIGRWLRGHS